MAIVSLLVLLAILMVKWWSNRRRAHLTNKLPGPYHYPFLGALPYFLFSPDKTWRYLHKFAKTHALPIYKTLVLNTLYVNLMVPEDIQVLLSSGKYLNKGQTYQLLEPWVGKGLFNSSGMKWWKRRKMTGPAFSIGTMRKFVEAFKEHAERFTQLIERESKKKYTEIEPLVSKSTMHVVCETVMGTKLDEDNEEVGKYLAASHRIGELFIHQLSRPWYAFLPIYPLTPSYWESRKVLKVLHDFTHNIIQEKWKNFAIKGASLKRGAGLLDLLIENSLDERIPVADIREEADAFMFAGHDTTTSMICFALLLLASHSEVQQKVYEEVEGVFSKTDDSTFYEDLQSMRYLDQVLKETLRLYPSGPMISRYITEEMTTHTGYTLPKGTNVNVRIYDIHHDPKLYPDPYKFDPERFSPENCKNRHPFAYLAFSAGPRGCMGNKFSLLMGKTIISSILREYEVMPVDTPKSITLVAHVVLKTKEPIKLKFRRR
ncbi:cytochrome P450 4C1-like isoform X1 [Photinus pyralis]|nr:cytochrome P450 4C1-like isoform X1 [Photinus pyralis]XP_031352910.1 cytochrome P450 4C1-like isoform X1 [Photinus pyralis]